MSIGRRDFFKVISAGAVTAATAGPIFAREKKTLAPDAVGILYDATLCIGCKICEYGCKEYNNMPIEQTDRVDDLNVPKIWDNSDDLTAKTLNKINGLLEPYYSYQMRIKTYWEDEDYEYKWEVKWYYIHPRIKKHKLKKT